MAQVPRLHAGFVSRAIAFTVDIVVMSGLLLVTIAFINAVLGFFTLYGVVGRSATVAGPLHTAVTVVLALIGVVIAVGYPVGFWVMIGQTPGKALMGLRVMRTDGQPLGLGRALLRYVGYWIAALPLFLGFLWVLGDPARRGWHDRLAGTCVVYTWHVQSNPTLLAEIADGSSIHAAPTLP
jgi:uncharacterized RDD family membrane protein YckC